MFKWLKLIGLRTKTVAVVELEYGRRLEIAGGPDSAAFNSVTRMIRDAGGNEYDAAAAFVLADVYTQMRSDDDASDRLPHIAETLVRLMPLMRRVELVDDMHRRLSDAPR